MFGPVANAHHPSAPTIWGFLWSAGIGCTALVYAWVRYLRTPAESPRPPVGNMIWISLIASAFIFLGIRELVLFLHS